MPDQPARPTPVRFEHAPSGFGIGTGTPRLSWPVPGGGLTSASAWHETPYGPAAVAWRRADGRLRLDVDVPVGVRAEIHVPGQPEPVEVGHGKYFWEVPDLVEPPRPVRTAPPEVHERLVAAVNRAKERA